MDTNRLRQSVRCAAPTGFRLGRRRTPAKTNVLWESRCQVDGHSCLAAPTPLPYRKGDGTMREQSLVHLIRSRRRQGRTAESLASLYTRRRAVHTLLSILLLCLAVGMAACDRASSVVDSSRSTASPTSPTSAPQPTTTPAGGESVAVASPFFPTFSDWRVAYVAGPLGQGDTGQLQAISPTGAATAAGPEVVGISPQYGLDTPSVSPNGQAVAIATSRGLKIVELTGQQHEFTFAFEASYRSIAWSPDSTLLAVAGATWQGVDIIRLSDGSLTKTPAVTGGTLPDIIGWVDTTHIIGYFFPAPPVGAPTPTPPHSDVSPPTGVQKLILATEEVTTGAIRIVASITSSTMGQGQCVLAPDGKFALFSNRAFRDNPYVPDVRLIDVTTGAVTSLPRVAQTMGSYSGFTSLAWKEGTMIVAASSGLVANGDLRTWLLDLAHDAVQPLPYQAYAGGWTPAGGPLILTSEQTDVTSGGPYKLTAVAQVTDGQGVVTVLTTNAYTFPFVGFVHTS